MNEASFEMELQKTFLAETSEMLNDAENILVQIEESSKDSSLFEKLIRILQPVQSSSQVVGFHDLAQFMLHYDKLLQEVFNKHITFNSEVLKVLLSSHNLVKNHINDLIKNPLIKIKSSDVENNIKSIMQSAAVSDNNNAKDSSIKQMNLETANGHHKKGVFLVCDDEEDILSILKDILEQEGYKVITANSAQMALDILESDHVDVIMSDLKMPKMDGITYVTKIREFNNFIPIILVSGHSSVEHFKKFIELGVHDFVDKPFAANDIIIVSSGAMKTKRLWDGIMTITKSCFQSYASLQKLNSLMNCSLDDNQQKEYNYLSHCMEEMRTATIEILSTEKDMRRRT